MNSNPLENAIQGAQNGRADVMVVIGIFLESRILVPSSSEFIDLKGFSPIIYEREEESFLATFSSLEKLGELANVTKNVANMTGSALLKTLRPGIGVVVNPGSTVGFEVLPETVREIIAHMPDEAPTEH